MDCKIASHSPRLPLALLALASVVVVTLPRRAPAQVPETVLFDFLPPNSGFDPLGPLVFDASGNLYGTTGGGGKQGWGTVFQLAPTPDGGWKQTELYSFSGLKDGGAPYAGLTIDASGNLYGTTDIGGYLGCGDSAGCGVVFELSPDANGTWTETVLYAFHNTDGTEPQATLVFDRFGNLYGTTNTGGQPGSQGFGTVFKLTPASGGWEETILHVFGDEEDGAYPVAPVILDSAGNVYGTATTSGVYCGCGVVFKLSQNSGGEWKETVLHYFRGGEDGAGPAAGLTWDANGNLYGTTFSGGLANGCPSAGGFGCGVVFELSPNSSGWTETVLHVFRGAQDGAGPISGVIFDAAGNLYGTAVDGGLATCSADYYEGCGVVFELTPRAGGGWWNEKVLHAFRDGDDGASPSTGLIFDGAGNLYGVSSVGPTGDTCCGAAFELSPN